jgi:hypothetical protein
MKWRPIKTAPKDKLILLLIDDQAIEGAYEKWCDEFRPMRLDSHGCGCCAGDDPPPTHWQKLPELPEEKTK